MGISLIVGGVLGARTVRTKLSLTLSVPSETRTVMVATPDCPADGWSEMVRFAPDPARTIFESGTRV